MAVFILPLRQKASPEVYCESSLPSDTGRGGAERRRGLWVLFILLFTTSTILPHSSQSPLCAGHQRGIIGDTSLDSQPLKVVEELIPNDFIIFHSLFPLLKNPTPLLSYSGNLTATASILIAFVHPPIPPSREICTFGSIDTFLIKITF